jgi:gamma-glutamyltranspeptidase/glutathione hydrolase
VKLEPGFDPEVLSGLQSRGHSVAYDQQESTFGGAQLIQRTQGAYVGGSDHRKEGQIAGF